MAKITAFVWIFFTSMACIDGMTMPFMSSKYQDEHYTCCVPLEWESLMFLDYGTVFIDSNGGTAFAYMNGTVHAAYSYAKKKAYFKIKGVEQSPLIPKPVPDDSTLLYDFEHGIMYTVSASGDCQKGELDNMTRQCIPGDAKLISSGGFGEKGLPVSTYRYTTTSDIQWQITATVFIHDIHPMEPRPCTPVQLAYFTPSVNPDSGSYYTLQVTDVGTLSSPDIFNVPKQCR